MNSIKNNVTTALITGLLPILAISPSVAGSAKWTIKPLGALSFDIGSKHAVGYFLSESNQCRLTVIIADSMKGDAVPTDAPVRFEVAVDAGKEARLNTTEGKSLMFTCAPGSQAMLVNMVEELATYTGPVR